MTSLQHHSHHVNHHNTPTSNNTSTTNIISTTPLNNSASNLSPVIQRKIDSQQLFPTNNSNNLQPPLFNQRYSSGSASGGVVGSGAVGGIDFDTTSIASVSESSHWSGGGGDDLDNIALVNGSDTNTMDNKHWSNYINSKNGYNSSEDDNEYDDDDDEENNNNDSMSTSSSTRTKLKSIDDSNSFKKSKKTSSTNLMNNNFNNNNNRRKSNLMTKTNDLIIKSKKLNKENEIDSTPNEQQHQQTNNNNNNNNISKMKNKRHNNLMNNTNNNNSISIATSNDEITDKKLPKKVSQDSLKSGAHILINNQDSSKLQDESKQLEDEDQLSTAANKHQNQEIKDENDFLDDDEDDDEEEGEEDDDNYNDFDEDDDEDDDEDEDDDDDLDDDDIWTIKPKLYSYYEKQFKIMQPNLNGFITGSVAKPFFERSRLPLNELSKIWELSDVTRDGALSFAEFCTAMHLVVLRVRNYDLPNELPAKLQPYAPLIDFNSETSAENANKINDESIHNLSDNEDLTLSSPTQSSTRFFNTGQINNSDKPLVFSIKPQIPSDIQIAHPVALRYNNASNLSNQHYQQQQQQQILTNYQQTNSNEIYSKVNDATLNTISISPASSNPIPEPPPRHSRSSSLVNITPTLINTPSTMNNPAIIMTPKILQQQPVVPPRITSPPPAFQQQHTYYHNQENESSNINATIMQQQQYVAAAAAVVASNALLPPPPPPPPLPHHPNLHHYQQQTRLQQHQNLTHNSTVPAVVSPTQFSIRAPPPIPGSFLNQSFVNQNTAIPSSSSSNPDDINKTIEKLIEQLNGFNLEKLKKSSETKQQQIGTSSSTSSTNSIERDALTSSIRTQTEQNQLLKRLFNELEKELRSLTDTRIALEIKLDFLNTATVNSNSNSNNNISNNNSSSNNNSNSSTVTNSNANVNTNQSIITSISQQQVNNLIQTPTTKQSIQKILPNTPASTVPTSNSSMTTSVSSSSTTTTTTNNNNNNNNNSS